MAQNGCVQMTPTARLPIGNSFFAQVQDLSGISSSRGLEVPIAQVFAPSNCLRIGSERSIRRETVPSIPRMDPTMAVTYVKHLARDV